MFTLYYDFNYVYKPYAKMNLLGDLFSLFVLLKVEDKFGVEDKFRVRPKSQKKNLRVDKIEKNPRAL